MNGIENIEKIFGFKLAFFAGIKEKNDKRQKGKSLIFYRAWEHHKRHSYAEHKYMDILVIKLL